MTQIRTRRLRANQILRSMVRETRVSPRALVYPLFIREGRGIQEPLPSLPGQLRYSPDTVCAAVEGSLAAGVSSFLLFGIPALKDEKGSGAWDPQGVVQQAARSIKRDFGDDVYLITDVCLCEYTSHGHCGLIVNEKVDNDTTLPLLAQTAVSHVQAGADMVAPSGMMDGTVAALRTALDAQGSSGTPIMGYSAKYASAFYGPFREAADSTPQFGDRRSYQMDFHNSREGIRRMQIDIDEGADMVMVKPALAYLDVIARAREQISVPLAAYSVSGEYAMIMAAGGAGLLDAHATLCESALSVFRAGADVLITYAASELAQAMRDGEIG